MSTILDTRVLDKLIKTSPAKVSKIVRDFAFTILGDAQIRAPFEFGTLRNSLEAEADGPFKMIIHDGVEYGIWQELGTSRMAAHPFLSPAVEHFRQDFYEAFRELERTG